MRSFDLAPRRHGETVEGSPWSRGRAPRHRTPGSAAAVWPVDGARQGIRRAVWFDRRFVRRSGLEGRRKFSLSRRLYATFPSLSGGSQVRSQEGRGVTANFVLAAASDPRLTRRRRRRVRELFGHGWFRRSGLEGRRKFSLSRRLYATFPSLSGGSQVRGQEGRGVTANFVLAATSDPTAQDLDSRAVAMEVGTR